MGATGDTSDHTNNGCMIINCFDKTSLQSDKKKQQNKNKTREVLINMCHGRNQKKA